MKIVNRWVCRMALGGTVLGLLGCVVAQGAETALDRYVAQPDPAFTFRTLRAAPGPGYKAWILEMTSQSWLTTAEVDRPVWTHGLNIVVPDGAVPGTGLLFIAGGDNNTNRPPRDPDGMLVRVAAASKSVVAELRMVPNQPLVFGGDGKLRKEDDLIAYTWDKFLRTGDERWPARLPMTKSAVRAMDTVTAFCASAEGGRLAVTNFVVSGGSKRGWTTWTTAAVDRRVVAIAPLVIDMLNIEPSFAHHWQVYGFWAPAVGDYVAAGIMDWMGTREFRNLMKIEEPFEYRDRLTMPKLIVNACGDQFFLPDSSQFYFRELRGPKYLRYVPNADHSLRDSDAPETLAAWQHAIVRQTPLPRFDWSSEADGTLRVKVTDRPQAVRLWQATNAKTRDFRLETIGKVWTPTELTEQGDGVYSGKASSPAAGWTAYFVELTYKLDGAPTPLKLTTQVNVTPETRPFKPYQPKRPQ